jgi:hypothetical protein
MSLSVFDRSLHENKYSSVHVTGKEKIFELEIANLLYEEIQMLLHNSEMFEEQYKVVIKYYERLTAGVTA